ncbi:autotransporter-associated beta strand repeat-containing protein [Pontiellaceae bacterium B12227]|nr:autotransporter-associated beta strand repeat-containing protein [Pontiellaceae bacterium B12227]
MGKTMKKSMIAAVVLTLGLVAPGFSQQTQTWIPTGATDNWNATDNNWDAGVAWTNNNDATFGGTAETIAVTETGIIFNDITFNSGYTIADGAGTLLLGNDQASTISVASGVTATIAETIGNNAAGASGLTKSDAGTLVLNGANTYTGTTTIDQGVLTLQGDAFSGTARDYSISSGAVLNLDGDNRWASGAKIFGTGTLRLTGGLLAATGNGQNLYMQQGSGGLIDIQAGAEFRNGGWGDVNWGSNLADMNVDGTLDVWDGQAVRVDALSGTGTVTHTSYGASTDLIVGVDDGSGTFDGTITDGGSSLALNLFKEGAGTQTLTGETDYTGSTTVNEGTLVFAHNPGVNDFTVNSSATLEFSSDGDQQINGGELTGGGTFVKSGSGTLQFGARNSEQLISMTGDGMIDVQEGTLRNEYSKGNWDNNLADLNVEAGATVDLWDSPGGITVDALTGGGTVQHTRYGNASDFTVGINGGTGSFSGNLTDDGSHDLNLVKAGAGTQTFTGANTHNGTTRAAGGTLAIENALGLQNSTLDLATADAGTVTFAQDSTLGGLTGSRNLNMGTHTFSIGNNNSDTDYSGTLSNGTLSKIGTGQLTLSGANAHDATEVIQGTLKIDNANAFGSGTVTAGSPGTPRNRHVVVDLNGQTVANDFSLRSAWSTTSLSNSDTENAATITGDILITGGGATSTEIGVSGDGDLNVGNVDGVSQTRQLYKTGNGTLTVANDNDNGRLNMTVAGGTIVLASQASGVKVTDDLTIDDGGTARLGSAGGSQQNVGDGKTVTINSGGVFDLNGFDETVASVSIAGTGISNGGALVNNSGSDSVLTSGLTMTADTSVGGSGNTTITGGVSGDTFSLTKVGAGTMTISGANTYTGGTFVNSGSLIMDGSMAGTVSVVDGQTLGGTGTFDGAVLVAGNLTPGNSPGTMTFNDALTLESTATLTLELDGTGASLYDILLNDGGDTLTAGGTLVFDTDGYTAVLDDTFTVFENWGDFAGSFSDIQGADLGGGLSLDTSDLLVDGTVTVIPEPATMGLVVAFGGGILLIRRRFMT